MGHLGLVGEAGIEPTTPGLEGRCSIQLSYSPTLIIVPFAVHRAGLPGQPMPSGRARLAQEPDHHRFGPMNLLASSAAKKRAVPPMGRLYEN